jgi:hypothetical protein
MSITRARTGRLAFALTCAAGAAAYLAIGLARGETGLAVFGPVIMLAYAAVLLVLARRSETAGLLSSNPSDERQAQIMQRSIATTGLVLVVVLVGGALTTLALGSEKANTFCALCAVGGVAFVGSTIWHTRRS